MKKINKIFKFVFAFALMFVVTISVNAQTVTMGKATSLSGKENGNDKDILMYDIDPSKLTGTTYKTVFIDGVEYNAYCLNHLKNPPATGTGFTVASLSSGQTNYMNAFIYIIENAYLNEKQIVNSFDKTAYSNYYATQLAIWGIQYKATRGTEGLNLETLNPTTENTKNIKNKAISLFDAALKHNDTSVYNLSVTSSDFKLDGNYYSSTFTVKGEGVSTYNFVVPGAPSGTQFLVDGKATDGKNIPLGKNFVVKVPVDAVKNSENGVTITATVSSTATGKKLAVYRPTSGNDYQDVGIPYPISIPLQDSAKASKKVNSVSISKSDATTGEELSGATLILKDSAGNLVERWTSEAGQIHTVTLKAGVYTLTEEIAPEGYEKSTETVTFEVDENGNVKDGKKVEMKNQPIVTVKISKQDITNKEELPGAHLVLKNSLGEVVEEWDSTNEPHEISTDKNPKLKRGYTYTLTETIVPDGYQATSETIEFTINKDGKIIGSTTMYNAPKTSVKISKQDITTKKELPGAHLIVKDKNGNVVDDWISKADNPHYLELEDGDYKLIEETAPDGYEISEEVIDFTIKNGEAEKTVVMYNSRIPKTGDINVTLITVGLIATALLVGFSIFKLNKQQEA